MVQSEQCPGMISTMNLSTAHLFLCLVPLYSTFWLLSESPPQPRLPRPGFHPVPLPTSCSLAPWATTCMSLSLGSLHSQTLPAWVSGPPRPAPPIWHLFFSTSTCLPGTSSTTTHVLYLIHSNILPAAQAWLYWRAALVLLVN